MRLMMNFTHGCKRLICLTHCESPMKRMGLVVGHGLDDKTFVSSFANIMFIVTMRSFANIVLRQ